MSAEELNSTAGPIENLEESGGPEAFGPGSLLRRERTSRGMSIHQVVEATRIQGYLIEAIEKEKWDELPSPVFVKGFMRGYARVLELDEQKVINLYNNVIGTQPPEQERPLTETEEKPRMRLLLVALLLAIGILTGAVLYFWQSSTVNDDRYTEADTQASVVERSVIPKTPIDDGTAIGLMAPLAAAPGESIEPQTVKPGIPEEKTDVISEESPPPVDTETVSPPLPQEQLPAVEALALELIVHERTWVSISVDGGAHRDFLFQPGSRPGWKDDGEYEMLIGNAGGVTLVYRGKTLRSLGNPGQVVRLRLPQDLDSLAEADR